MPTVRFTDNIQRQVECPTRVVSGARVCDALDIDESGEVLAFGSTTGSLWVTENGGDSWQTVSSNLPPIHSVRFGQSG